MMPSSATSPHRHPSSTHTKRVALFVELPLTPLLASDSALDERQRGVVRRVAEAEYSKILSLPTDDPLDPKRRSRVGLTRTEMLGQPEAIQATWNLNAERIPVVAQRIARMRLQRVYLAGAGDSYAVMVAARGFLEAMTGVPCEPVQSLELAYYHAEVMDPSVLVIALSSSGETTRTVEAVLAAQHAGAMTLALSNTEGSTLVQECSDSLLIEATRKGWPTQASTAALALLLRLGLEIGRRRGVGRLQPLEKAILDAPEVMQGVMSRCEDQVAEIACRESHRTLYLFSAGGPNWSSALMGAAKIKECSPDHALAIHVEEYHHYNSQKPGEPLWLVAPNGRSVSRALDTGRDARRYGGQLYVVVTEGQQAFDKFAHEVISLPPVPEMVSPLVYVTPVQMFGYHVAAAKFADAERASR